MVYKDSEIRKAKQAEYRKNNKEKLCESQKRYRQNNKEKLVEKNRRYRQANPESTRKQSAECNRKARQRIRRAIFALLGEVCINCGFNDVRALQVDHIKGGGTKERNTTNAPTVYYRRVLEVGKAEYQILCANCNQIKRIENNEHRQSFK